MASIVVLGSFNMDLVVQAEQLPAPGETVRGHSFQRGPGGKGSNQAIAARRLGADVTFIGAVGDDGFGTSARQLYMRERIDAAGLSAVPGPTGVALIVVDAEAENQIAVASGANMLITAEMVAAHADRIAAADVVLAQLETPVAAFTELARIASEHGTHVILNPAPAAELPDGVFEHIDVITPNQHELTTMTGVGNVEWAATALANRGDGMDVIVTRGPFGVTWTSESGTQSFPSVSADAADTTGAGDAFNAGLAVGLAETGSVASGIELGLRAGAFAVSQHGVLDGLATRAQLDALFPAN